MRPAHYSLAFPLDWERSNRLLQIVVLGSIILLSHGCLDLTFDKKAGIPFLREAVVIALVPLSVWFLLKFPSVLRLKMSMAVLAYTVAFCFLSAILAWFWFGQPLQYALLEERRVLGMLWFFPALWFVIKTQPTANEVQQGVLIAGVTLSIYSLLYYTGIIPDNQVSSDVFIEQYFYADDDPRNLTRYVLGSSLLVVVIPLALLMLLQNRQRGVHTVWILSALIGCVFTLLMIDQSRSALISMLAVIFFALLGQVSPHWKPPVIAAAIFAAFFVGALLIGAQSEKVQWLLNSLVSGQGVRNQTSQIIWQVMKDTWFWGHGALSIQYNRGFLAIYNENFWLNDVGKLGLLYRFGFLTLLFVAFYFYVLRFLIVAKRQLPDLPLLRVLVWVYLVTLITPWGSVSALLPAELGIVLGLLVNHENRSSS